MVVQRRGDMHCRDHADDDPQPAVQDEQPLRERTVSSGQTGGRSNRPKIGIGAG
jgi:hypothetical protein